MGGSVETDFLVSDDAWGPRLQVADCSRLVLNATIVYKASLGPLEILQAAREQGADINELLPTGVLPYGDEVKRS